MEMLELFILLVVFGWATVHSLNVNHARKVASSRNRYFLRAVSPAGAFEYPVPNAEDKINISDLPLDFDDSVKRSVSCTYRLIKQENNNRVRIDFDTTIGDATYTSLQNTLPFLKAYLLKICEVLNILPQDFGKVASTTFVDEDDHSQNTDSLEIRRNQEQTEGLNELKSLQNSFQFVEQSNSETDDDATTRGPVNKKIQKRGNGNKESLHNFPAEEKTIRVFFPDMGSAILARNDWKQTTDNPKVPRCVVTANVKNPTFSESDILAIILCPQSSEEESVTKILQATTERNIPAVLINPKLINMDQGFGVRARHIQRTVLDSLVMAYELKTLRLGAIVREYPRAYSLWIEDASRVADGGYAWYGNYNQEPAFSDIEELFERIEAHRETTNNKKQPNSMRLPGSGVVKEMLSFFQGLQRL